MSLGQGWQTSAAETSPLLQYCSTQAINPRPLHEDRLLSVIGWRLCPLVVGALCGADVEPLHPGSNVFRALAEHGLTCYPFPPPPPPPPVFFFIVLLCSVPLQTQISRTNCTPALQGLDWGGDLENSRPRPRTEKMLVMQIWWSASAVRRFWAGVWVL